MNNLPENHKICLYALRGCHIRPEGGVVPCCIAKVSNHIQPNIKNIHNERNNEWHVKLRKDLYNGIENPICNTCWDSEKKSGSSYRTEVVQQNPGILENIKINSDGTLADDIINFWDIRDTNKCNMKCLNCNPGYSSLFNQEALINQHNEKYKNYIQLRPRGDTAISTSLSEEAIHTQILPSLNEHTKHLYFAGGEPLISDSHYYILKYLVDNDLAKNIKLFYNTNLLKTSHFGIDLSSLWDEFGNVVLGLSIDAIEERAEFARYGTNWKTINENILKIKNTNARINVNSTQSPYTFFKLHETINWFHSVIEYSENRSTGIFRFSIAIGSDKWSLQVIPYELRLNYLNYIESNFDVFNEFKFSQYNYFKKTVLVQEGWDQDRVNKARKDLKYYLDLMDSVRGTNWQTTCPEIVDILN